MNSLAARYAQLLVRMAGSVKNGDRVNIGWLQQISRGHPLELKDSKPVVREVLDDENVVSLTNSVLNQFKEGKTLPSEYCIMGREHIGRIPYWVPWQTFQNHVENYDVFPVFVFRNTTLHIDNLEWIEGNIRLIHCNVDDGWYTPSA